MGGSAAESMSGSSDRESPSGRFFAVERSWVCATVHSPLGLLRSRVEAFAGGAVRLRRGDLTTHSGSWDVAGKGAFRSSARTGERGKRGNDFLGERSANVAEAVLGMGSRDRNWPEHGDPTSPSIGRLGDIVVSRVWLGLDTAGCDGVLVLGNATAADADEQRAGLRAASEVVVPLTLVEEILGGLLRAHSGSFGARFLGNVARPTVVAVGVDG